MNRCAKNKVSKCSGAIRRDVVVKYAVKEMFNCTGEFLAGLRLVGSSVVHVR